MEENRAKILIRKYLSGNCTPEEKIIVESWYTKELSSLEDKSPVPAYDEVEQEIWNKLPHQNKSLMAKMWVRITIAASLFIFVAAGFYFIEKQERSFQKSQFTQYNIIAGSTKAILILSDGKRVELTNAKNGILANQGSAEIRKVPGGEISYTNTKPTSNGTSLYNTMTTPVGGQYRLVLADGTQVWLNAASSIRYPTAFEGNTRNVEVTGEAYFEVAHDSARPFRVTTGNQTVEVLGTHFNISGYPDEPVTKTTLLTGSIRIAQSGKTVILKPGQQSQVNGQKGITVTDHANIEEAVAWKNGYFRFNNENIRSVMRKLSRWYDVDIEYRGLVSDEGFYGTISKYKTIIEVLEMIQQTKGVHFKIEGRRIIVIK